MLGHFGHGHFGPGRFGLDISATEVSATEKAEGGRFGHNHNFGFVMCMHKYVMHFIIFEIKYACEYIQLIQDA